jgi:puromycin-sensitive aminopeptidase
VSALGLALLQLSLGAYRLPEGIRPQRYELNLTVLPAKGTFSGGEAIAVTVAAPTRTIDLHAVDLFVTQAMVEQGGKSVPAQITPVAREEVVTLTLPAELKPGAAVVRLSFTAKLRDDLRGLYLAKSKSGEPFAFTQFEPTDARRAFPCFDEPAFKATYRLTVTVPQGLTAVSNGPQLSETPDKNGMDTFVFAETEPISSYLVALAVGRFSSVSGSAAGKPIRVITLAGDEALADFALTVAEALLPWYESYFGVPYPYPKLDLLAVPDFEAGAMENAGAIFFRDSALLLDPHAASVQAKQRVAVTVAHEMAHQWFGDLVTMAWWDDLWLNEAFATLMESKSVEAIHPEYHIYDEVQLETEHALRSDSLAATHPIHVAVQTAEEANALFDDITYLKGAAVLRMFEQYLTPDAFRAGLHAYFVAHAKGNAAQADLWSALGRASGKDVAALAHSWFDREGYPLVQLRRTKRELQIAQRRFVVSVLPMKGDATPWQIPFCYRLGAENGQVSQACRIVTEPQAQLTLSAEPRFLQGNAGAVGFYRVSYAVPELMALGKILAKGVLSAPERISLLADTWWLMRAGQGSVGDSLELIQKLSGERSYAVMSTALGQLEQVGRTLVGAREQPAFRAYATKLLNPTATSLGWKPAPDESPDTQELRGAVLATLGTLADDATVIAEARRRLADYEHGTADALDPSVLGAAIQTVAAHGDGAVWDDFRARYASAKTPELRQLYLSGLTGFRDPALIVRTLALVTSGDVLKQDSGWVLGGLIDNRYAQAQVWTFLKAHWPEIKARVTPQSLAWRFIPSLGSMCEPGLASEVQTFFGTPERHIEGGDRALQQAAESIELCARTRERQSVVAATWFHAQVLATGSKSTSPKTKSSKSHPKSAASTGAQP